MEPNSHEFGYLIPAIWRSEWGGRGLAPCPERLYTVDVMKTLRPASTTLSVGLTVCLGVVCCAMLGCVDFDSQDPVVDQPGDGLLGLVNLTDFNVTATLIGASRI